jgi:hypothetical protein
MLKLGTPVRYQGHWGRVIARTFGRERLYDLNLADGRNYVRCHTRAVDPIPRIAAQAYLDGGEPRHPYLMFSDASERFDTGHAR